VLTVLMPVGAVDEFLPIAVDSIKNQTFDDFVCHILCGQLTEDELARLNGLVSDDERFVLHHLILSGITFALNYGLNLVKTKYVARMDSDDVSYPTRFEKQINFLEENINYVAVGCRVTLVDEYGEIVNQKFKFFEDDREIRRALKYRMPLCHPAMIFRTDTLLSHRGYMYGNTSEDHELYLRVARNPNSLFKNLPDNLLSYRRHGNQLTNPSNAHKAYCNIAGFLFTEFLLTWNPAYLLGMVSSHPLLRKFRAFLRKCYPGMSR
jgi:glycosyltransferase involved in cell wall biosynthesis